MSMESGQGTPNFYLSRGDAATLLFALDEYRKRELKALERMKRTDMDKLATARLRSRVAPGRAAARAAAATDAQILRSKVMDFVVAQGWALKEML